MKKGGREREKKKKRERERDENKLACEKWLLLLNKI